MLFVTGRLRTARGQLWGADSGQRYTNHTSSMPRYSSASVSELTLGSDSKVGRRGTDTAAAGTSPSSDSRCRLRANDSIGKRSLARGLMSRDDLSIAAVRGGIGGLTAALSLLRAGFDGQVFEQAQALMDVGASIQITPDTSGLLHRLGLAPALDRTACVRPSISVDGMTAAPCSALRSARRWRPPSAHLTTIFHRADLLKMLADALPPSVCTSAIASPALPTTVIVWSCGSPTARGWPPAY